MNKLNQIVTIFIFSLIAGLSYNSQSQTVPEKVDVRNYSAFNSFDEMIEATDVKYLNPVRISPVGTKEKPMYNGFFYYNHTPSECLQFEPTERYLLGMRIYIEGRKVHHSIKGKSVILICKMTINGRRLARQPPGTGNRDADCNGFLRSSKKLPGMNVLKTGKA